MGNINKGISGSQGIQGIVGPGTYPTGATGYSGIGGYVGATGYSGISGPIGITINETELLVFLSEIQKQLNGRLTHTIDINLIFPVNHLHDETRLNFCLKTRYVGEDNFSILSARIEGSSLTIEIDLDYLNDDFYEKIIGAFKDIGIFLNLDNIRGLISSKKYDI